MAQPHVADNNILNREEILTCFILKSNSVSSFSSAHRAFLMLFVQK